MIVRTRLVPVVLALVLAAGLVGAGPVSQARPARAAQRARRRRGGHRRPVLPAGRQRRHRRAALRRPRQLRVRVRAAHRPDQARRARHPGPVPVQPRLPAAGPVGDASTAARPRSGQAGDHELRITPAARARRPAAEFRVSVRYAGVPAARDARAARATGWPTDTEVVTMNEPHMATWWFPANDHPRDKASFDIRITVPRGQGRGRQRRPRRRRKRHGRATTHWRAVEPMAPYLAFFAAGDFETRSASCNGIPNYVAVSRQPPPAPAARRPRAGRPDLHDRHRARRACSGPTPSPPRADW